MTLGIRRKWRSWSLPTRLGLFLAVLALSVGAAAWLWPDLWKPDPHSAWIASSFFVGDQTATYTLMVGRNLTIKSYRPRLTVISVKENPLLELSYTTQKLLWWKRQKVFVQLHLRDRNGMVVADAEDGRWKVYDNAVSEVIKTKDEVAVWDNYRDAYLRIHFDNPKQFTVTGKMYWEGHIFFLNDDGLSSPTELLFINNLIIDANRPGGVVAVN